MAQDKQLEQLTRAELYQEITRLRNNSKKFGLVWEEKLDEKALMLETLDPVLVLHPELSVRTDEGSVTHMLINGDNSHGLTALMNDYQDKVDIIYIDPPYNTGTKDFIYNDSYLDKKDGYKHSKWLSFMESRLRLARRLLCETGVILVAIDDKEHARLRLLMDEIFGDKNFLANIVWQGSPSSLGRFTSGGVDYMLAYGKDAKKAPKWRKKKPFAEEMVSLATQVIRDTGSSDKATLAIRSFINRNKDSMDSGLKSYSRVDSQGRVYSSSMLTNSLYRPNLKYPIKDPATGIEYEPPKNGWKLSRDTMQDLIDKDLVIFGGKYPRKKCLLSDYLYSLPMQTFTASRSQGSAQLSKILGKGAFDFPKNTDVIKEWLATVNNQKDAIILDFFAGSGTTLQAVAELNKLDKGQRKCILITDEGKALGDKMGRGSSSYVNIAKDVAYQRAQRVLTGENWVDGKEHEALGGNLDYYSIRMNSKSLDAG